MYEVILYTKSGNKISIGLVSKEERDWLKSIPWGASHIASSNDFCFTFDNIEVMQFKEVSDEN